MKFTMFKSVTAIAIAALVAGSPALAERGGKSGERGGNSDSSSKNSSSESTRDRTGLVGALNASDRAREKAAPESQVQIAAAEAAEAEAKADCESTGGTFSEGNCTLAGAQEVEAPAEDF